jgi:hypothetical protein
MFHRIAQNIADFLFHGMAVSSSTLLELPLDRLLQLADSHLSHINSPCYHDSTARAEFKMPD